MTHILYLDDFHLGDPMFLGRLGRGIARSGLKLAVVHSPREIIEREIESLGIFPAGNDQAMAGQIDQSVVSAIIRVCKDQNRTITHELNEAGIAAVPMEGTSRGLLIGGHEEGLRVGKTVWLKELIQSGGVPVIAPLAESRGERGVIDAVALVELLVEALSDGCALLMPRKLSAVEKLTVEDLSDVEAGRILLKAGLRVAAAVPGIDGIKPLEIPFST